MSEGTSQTQPSDQIPMDERLFGETPNFFPSTIETGDDSTLRKITEEARTKGKGTFPARSNKTHRVGGEYSGIQSQVRRVEDWMEEETPTQKKLETKDCCPAKNKMKWRNCPKSH